MVVSFWSWLTYMLTYGWLICWLMADSCVDLWLTSKFTDVNRKVSSAIITLWKWSCQVGSTHGCRGRSRRCGRVGPLSGECWWLTRTAGNPRGWVLLSTDLLFYDVLCLEKWNCAIRAPHEKNKRLGVSSSRQGVERETESVLHISCYYVSSNNVPSISHLGFCRRYFHICSAYH